MDNGECLVDVNKTGKAARVPPAHQPDAPASSKGKGTPPTDEGRGEQAGNELMELAGVRKKKK